MRWRDEFDLALALAMSAYFMPLALPVVLSGAPSSTPARREPTEREVDVAFARIVRGLERNGGRGRW